MGKKKDISEFSSGEGKKHKKHKHKKHRKKRSDNDIFSDEGTRSDVHSSHSHFPIVQLTPGRSLSSTPKSNDSHKQSSQHGISPKSSKKKKKGRESDEEEKWLDAIESGKLEEVDDELKKMKTKDPKLMTARQRAMLERKGDAVPDPAAQQQLLSLPSGYKESVLSPEMMKKAAQKRRQLVEEKREKDQKRTVERLLGKQEAKPRKLNLKKTIKKSGLTIKLINNLNEIRLLLPPGVDYPLKAQTMLPPPVKVLCGLQGCGNLKRYSCRKTGVPLCSLGCYKKNLLIHHRSF